MNQPTSEPRGDVLRRGKHGQHGGPVAIIVLTPSSAEDAFAVI
jgi:hypothetical protein